MNMPLPSLENRTRAGVPVLTDDALFEACGARVVFSGRAGGVSEGAYASLNTGGHVGDDVAVVDENRRRLLDAAGAGDAHLLVANQVHGTQVVRVEDAAGLDQARNQLRAGADAVVVRASGVAALLNFADCLPLVVVSPSGAFAVVHAGWRGAVAHIAAKAVASLAQGDAFSPAEFNAYIGPHIRSECFEVGSDVAREFQSAFPAVSGVLADERHVSLAAAVASDLVSTGLAAGRIADAGLCTACHPDRFFSYRASDGTCGRHAALAVGGTTGMWDDGDGGCWDDGDGGCCPRRALGQHPPSPSSRRALGQRPPSPSSHIPVAPLLL